MTLEKYRAKRDFKVSPEPNGATKKEKTTSAKLSFVVQKHQATRLHYDFRLEWNGVLISWAVPKGPSMDPSVKRLAMAVEDHPLEYGGFEGVIPEGEYGGGTVMVWDQGDWEPEMEVDAGLREGELKFTLYGKKLRGSWALIRTKGMKGNSDRPAWLLIKHRDKYATEDDIATKKPRSIVSKKLMAQIARAAGGDVEKAAKADPAL